MKRIRGFLLASSLLPIAACAPPPGPTYAIASGTRLGIVSYAAGLTYDTAHGVSDSRRLMKIGILRLREYGTEASIQPRLNAHMLTMADLDSGVVVARVITRGHGRYGKFQLPDTGVVYLWVRQHAAPGDTVAAFIPANPSQPAGRAKLRFHANPGYPISIAKWVFDWNDDLAWVTCTSMGCCYIDPV